MPKEPSRFAASVAAIIDHPETCSRKEWAQKLNVSTAALSQWTNDISIPHPATLNALIEVARGYPGAADAVSEFLDVTSLPVHKATSRIKPQRRRLEDRSLSCLGDYLLEPKLDRFLQVYSGLTVTQKEAALDRALKVVENVDTSSVSGDLSKPIPIDRNEGRSVDSNLFRQAARGIRENPSTIEAVFHQLGVLSAAGGA